jgi:hypothetical protein
MLAAESGNAKTMLALKWVAAMKLPALFFSADTDPNTMAVRSGAMVTGEPQSTVEDGLRGDKRDEYADCLNDVGHIRWVWESDPTYTDIVMETMAFAETYGDFPRVIVIDNLMNLVAENDNEWSGMRDHTRALHRLVRVTDAACFVLTHMSETDNRGGQYSPPAKNRIQGKISQLPEMILSLLYDQSLQELKIACVKNRFGPGDPSGQTYSTIIFDAERVQFFASREARQLGMPI